VCRGEEQVCKDEWLVVHNRFNKIILSFENFAAHLGCLAVHQMGSTVEQ